MSDAQQFISGGALKPAGLINGASQLGALTCEIPYPLYYTASGHIKSTVSGSLTANTLSTVLNLSGRGVLSFLACASTNAGSRSHRFKVTLDGIVIFDGTSTASNQVNNYYPVFGQLVQLSATYTSFAALLEPIPFDKSLLIEYASNQTEIGGTTLAYRYYPR